MNFWVGKSVIVTGSSRGIGRKAAELLLQAGARVVLNGRDPAKLLRTQKELIEVCALGNLSAARLAAVPGDISRPAEAQKLVKEALNAFGRIDVLINNAGLSMRGDFLELSPMVVKSIVESNLYSALYCTQAALPALRASGGRVLFVSSLAGVRGFPGVSIYSASKMALLALQQSLTAEEPREGVRFGVLWLGFTENDEDKKIFRADGQLFRHQRKWQVTQLQAAEALLSAVRRGRRKTVVTFTGKLLFFFQAHFPTIVDFALKRGKRLHEVEEASDQS